MSYDGSDKNSKAIFKVPWEEIGIDYGLHLLFKHMDAGRKFVKHVNIFRRNKEIAMEKAKFDDVMVDMFSTEFQLKFLWGSKGAKVASSERYSKFQQVLDVMSKRCDKK